MVATAHSDVAHSQFDHMRAAPRGQRRQMLPRDLSFSAKARLQTVYFPQYERIVARGSGEEARLVNGKRADCKASCDCGSTMSRGVPCTTGRVLEVCSAKLPSSANDLFFVLGMRVATSTTVVATKRFAGSNASFPPRLSFVYTVKFANADDVGGTAGSDCAG